MTADIRLHPKCLQLGFTKRKFHRGPFHLDLPSEWNEHLLMIHLLWITIVFEWNTYP